MPHVDFCGRKQRGGAVRGRGPCHVHVGPEPAVGPVGSTQCFSVYAWVYLYVRGLCARGVLGSMRNSRGIPKPPSSSSRASLLWRRSLPQAFFPLSHLVSGMSHLTERLGHLGLNGFYSFTGNHPIPPTHLQLQYHSFQCRWNMLMFSCVWFDI